MVITRINKTIKRAFNILLFFLACFLSWPTLGLIRPIEWDEGVHIYYAYILFENGFVTWDYTHGPVISYILHPLTTLLDDITLVRLIFAIILIYLLSLILYLLRIFESTSLTVVSAVTLSLSQAFLVTGTRIRPDFLFCLFFLFFYII